MMGQVNRLAMAGRVGRAGRRITSGCLFFRMCQQPVVFFFLGPRESRPMSHDDAAWFRSRGLCMHDLLMA